MHIVNLIYGPAGGHCGLLACGRWCALAAGAGELLAHEMLELPFNPAHARRAHTRHQLRVQVRGRVRSSVRLAPRAACRALQRVPEVAHDRQHVAARQQVHETIDQQTLQLKLYRHIRRK